jgi:hypothetical protein
MELINHKNAETYAITQCTKQQRRPSTLMNSDFLILTLIGFGPKQAITTQSEMNSLHV